MTADIHDFMALAVVMMGIGLVIYCMMPSHWQTPGGFALIVVGIVPAVLVALTIFAQPAFLIPAALVMGALMTRRS